jgi:hypothetical protein
MISLQIGVPNHDEVKLMQQLLTKAGFPLEDDGDFGLLTHKALRAFQRRSGLVDDGIAGPITLAALGFKKKLWIPEKPSLGTWRRLLLETAFREVGVKEIGYNRGPVEKYQRAAGISPGDPYCVAGIFWSCLEVAKRIGNTNPQGLSRDVPMPRTGSSHVLYEWATGKQRTKRLFDAIPGDVFFMDFGHYKGHVGIIVDQPQTGVYQCVEWNTKPSAHGVASGEGDGVWEKMRRYTEFDGMIDISPMGEQSE